MMTRIYTLLFFAQFLTNAQAQIISIAQPFLNPMSVNPAFTGATNYESRFAFQYKRWQNVRKDELVSFAFDRRFDLKDGDYWGIGVHIWQGEVDILKQRQFKTSVAYGKYLGGDGKGEAHYLLAGGEIGRQQTVLNYNNDPFIAATNLATGNGSALPVFKIDSLYLATGATWCGSWKNGSRAHVGVAVHRLFTPFEGYTDKLSLPLKWRYTFHANYEIPLKKQLRLVPTAMYLRQGTGTEIRGGLAVKFTAGDTLGLQLGTFIRRNLKTQNSFACVFLQLDWMRYIFNVSFDAGRIPASEGAVIYRFGEMVDRRFRLPSW